MLGTEEHNLIIVLVVPFVAMECDESNKLGEKDKVLDRLEMIDWV